MTNMFVDVRRYFLLLLLLWLPPSLQNRMETNAGQKPQAAHFKTGPRSLMSRDLLSTSVEKSDLTRMGIPSDEEDLPGNADKALVKTLQRNAEDASASPEGAPSAGSESEPITKPPSIYFGPLSDYYPRCLRGVDYYQESFAICRDYLGIPVHMPECNPTKESWDGSFITYDKPSCSENVTVELTSWDPCPKTCTKVEEDGTVVLDKVKRSWKCRSNTPSMNSGAAKDCDPLIEQLGLTLERECPLKPCTDYRLEASSWGKCNCDTFTRQRTNRCKAIEDANSKVQVEICQKFGLELLRDTQTCLPQRKCNSTKHSETENALAASIFNFCNYYNCSTHGTCKDNDCRCEKGFSGHDCQYDNREADGCLPPSVLLGDGTCCESGIFNYTGHCCPGDNSKLTIDKNGDCCLGELDMCGNCNPEEPEFRDVRGTCCKVLDAGGFCCPSGKVDECGVCDGLSLTCNTFVSLSVEPGTEVPDYDACIGSLLSNLARSLRVPASDLHQETVDEGRTFTFTAKGVIASSGVLAKKVRGVAKAKGVQKNCGSLVNPIQYRSPERGNSFCEIGEASSDSPFHCPDDCTYETARCPLSMNEHGHAVVCSGHGSCSIREPATCECFDGYSGSNCEKCQYGFFSPGKDDSRCLPRQAYVNGPTPLILPAAAPEQTPIEAPMPSEEEPGEASLPSEKEPGEASLPSEKEPGEASLPSEKEPGEASLPSEEEPSKVSLPSEEEPGEASLPSEEEPGEVSLPSEEEPGEVSLPSEDELGEASVPSEKEPGEASLPSEEEPGEASLPSEEEPSKVSLPSEDELGEASVPSEEEPGEASLPSEEEPGEASLPSEEEPGEASLPSEEEPGEASLPSEKEPGEASLPSKEEPGEASLPSKEEPGEASLPSEEEPGEASLPSEEEPTEQSLPPEEQEEVSLHPAKKPGKASPLPGEEPAEPSLPSETAPGPKGDDDVTTLKVHGANPPTGGPDDKKPDADDDDDGGISKGGAIGIAIACAFVLLILILLCLYCLSKSAAAGAASAAGYVPVAAGPETVVAAEVTTAA